MPRLFLAEPQQAAQMPRTNALAYGAQIGDAMDQTGRLSQALGQVVNEYVNSNARVAAVQFEQALKSEANQISLDPDISTRQEKLDAARKQLFDQFRPKIGGQGEYEKRASLAAGDIHNSFTHTLMVDGIKQMRANNDIELDAITTKAANAVSLDELDSFIAQGEEAVASSALYYTPAEQQAKAQGALAQTIGLLAQNNPALAKQAIETYGHRLTPEAQLTLGKQVEAENNVVEAQRVADEAIGIYGRGGSLDAMLGYVQKNSSGEIRNAAEAQVTQLWNAHNASETRRQGEVSDGYATEIANFFESDPDPSGYSKKWHDVRKRAEARGLDAGRISTLKSVFDGYAQDAGEGRKFATDWGLYNTLLTNPTLVGTEGYTLADIRLRLATPQLKEIVKLSADRELGIFGNQEMINAAVTTELARQKITDKDEQGLYRAQIQAQLMAYDGPITPQLVQSKAQEAVARRVDAGWFAWDDARAGFDASLEEYKEGDPDLYKLAYYRASGGGKYRPADIQIEAQVDAIRTVLRSKRSSMDTKQYNAAVSALQKSGKSAAAALLKSPIASYAEEDLDVTDAERKALLAPTQPTEEGPW